MKGQSPPNATHIVETYVILCCLLPGGVFYSYNKPNSLCTVDDLKVIFEQYDIHAVNGPLRIIAEMGEHSQMDKKSLDFLKNHEVDAICEAVVIEGLAQRLLLNSWF